MNSLISKYISDLLEPDNHTSHKPENNTYDYLYINLADYFLTWYLPLVLLMGFIGSIFCLLFIIRSKMFAMNMRFWLICIYITDFLILLFEGIWMLMKVWYRFDLRDLNNALCIIHTGISNYLLYCSAYAQCFVSVQRCYIVIRPIRSQTKPQSLKKLICWLAFTAVLLLIPTAPYPIFWRVINDDCDPINGRVFRLTTILDLTFWGLLPGLLMTTSTAIIWHNLIVRRRRQFGMNGHFNMPTNLSSHKTAGMHPVESTPNVLSLPILEDQMTNIPRAQSSMEISVDRAHRSKKIENHNHVTLILICINVVYLISVFPLMIYFIYLNFFALSIDQGLHRFFYYLFRSFCFLNACTNWIFYCVAGDKFRRQTKQLLAHCCFKPCQKDLGKELNTNSSERTFRTKTDT